MKFWRGSSRKAQGLDAELDACLNLLGSRPAGRDQTDAILSRVSVAVPLGGVRRQRVLTVSRIAAGLLLTACVGATLLTVRAWNQTRMMESLVGPTAPMSRAVTSTLGEVDQAVRSLRSASRGAPLLRPASLITADIELEAPIASVSGRPAQPTAIGLLDRVLPARPRDLAESVAWEVTGGDAADTPLPR